MNGPYYGFYSATAAQLYGSNIYRRADGVEVEVTSASQNPNFEYGFKDAVFLGEVGQFSHHGRQGDQTRIKEFNPFDMRHEPAKEFAKIYPIFDAEKIGENIRKFNENQPNLHDILNDPKFVALVADISNRLKKDEDEVTPIVLVVSDGVTTVEGGK